MDDKFINCDFYYKCPLNWDKLTPIENENVRFCNSCQKDVYFAHSQSELDKLAGEGKCVALRFVEPVEYSPKNNEITYNEITCSSCKSLVPSTLRFCFICGNLLRQLPEYPVTMGIIMPLPEEKKIEEIAKPEVKKSWWKFWK